MHSARKGYSIAFSLLVELEAFRFVLSCGKRLVEVCESGGERQPRGDIRPVVLAGLWLGGSQTTQHGILN